MPSLVAKRTVTVTALGPLSVTVKVAGVEPKAPSVTETSVMERDGGVSCRAAPPAGASTSETAAIRAAPRASRSASAARRGAAPLACVGRNMTQY